MGNMSWVRIGWLALLVVSLSLHLTYQLSPNYVAADGTLVEEFWALALGQFFLVAAVLVAIVDAYRTLKRR